MRSSFSRSLAQPSVSRRAAAIIRAWSESMKTGGAGYGRSSSLAMTSLLLGRRELRAQGGQHPAPHELERPARGHVGDGEQEVAHARRDVLADPAHALLGRS